jgi:hypothetical protein
MKKRFFLVFVFCCLVQMNCFLFSNFQSARLLDRGERQIVPNTSAACFINDQGHSTLMIPAGLRYDFAPSSRLNLLISEGFYYTHHRDDENELQSHIFNSGGIEAKIGLVKNTTALSFLLNYHLGDGEYDLALQSGTKLISSFYFGSGMDLTVTPHWGFVLSGYPAQYAGIHVSLGVPLSKGAHIRPEISIANIDWDNEYYANIGIGFEIPLASARSGSGGKDGRVP